MTGLRIGYTIADKPIIEKMVKLQALCITNVAEPIQYAALKALGADITQNPKTVKSKIDVLVKAAKNTGLEFLPPDGAMYLFAKINKPGFDGLEFANRLLDHGVGIAPGDGFGNYKSFIRISACQDKDVLQKGMMILDEVLKGS
jgi:aspartate aminotransferase